MMSGVDAVSLNSIAAEIVPPLVPDRVPPGDEPVRPPDRLVELARWWTRVSAKVSEGEDHLPEVAPPAGPVRVVRLWDGATWAQRPETVAEAIAWGLDHTDPAIDGGADLVVLSIPGAGSVAAAALTGALLQLDAVEAAGWPMDVVSDQDWMQDTAAIRDGLRRIRSPRDDAGGQSWFSALHLGNSDPAQLLHRLDDTAMAAGFTALARCAARRTPMILEGQEALACGLLGRRFTMSSRDWWQAADGPVLSPVVSGRRGGLHERLLEALDCEPLTRLGLAEADGTAARIAVSILHAAIGRGAQ